MSADDPFRLDRGPRDKNQQWRPAVLEHVRSQPARCAPDQSTFGRRPERVLECRVSGPRTVSSTMRRKRNGAAAAAAQAAVNVMLTKYVELHVHATCNWHFGGGLHLVTS
jgi:hypothetical protein